MPNPYLLPSAPPDVVIPTTAGGTPTTFQLGAWNVLADSFVAHSSSPTGAIIDLNDGLTWSLVDDESGNMLGEGLDWGTPTPTVYKSSNPRTVGERVPKRNYQNNRSMKAHLFLGQSLTYSAFITAIHNLVQTCEGISQTNPGALKIQVVQAGAPVYADVLEAHVETGYREVLWSQLLDDGIVVTFECRPFFRGPRQTLQNYAVNAGFEAPSGPGVPVFSDNFANTNAYVVQAGGSPTLSPANTYVDIVAANAPAGGALLRYYRLDEASGTSAFDIGGTGDTGTITASGVTYGVAGAISGDTDTAMTFTTSGNIQATSATNMPTGSAACSLSVWVNCAATPGSLGVALSIGNWASNPYLAVTSAGKAEAGVTGLGTVDSAGTPFTSAGWHHLALTYAGGTGGTVTLYLDGVSSGTFTATAAISYSNGKSVTISTNQGNTHPLAASIDEPCVYSGALSGAQVTAIYNAGHSGATGTLSSAMTIPSGARVAFGSPAWGAINTWQVRFRFLSGNTSRFHLHFTDVSPGDFLYAVVTGTTLTLNQTIAGTNNVLVTKSINLTHEAWYWIECTQFPTVPGAQVSVQAVLLYDSNGQPSTTQVTTTGSVFTTDQATALVGRPQLQASTGALTIGGAFTASQQPTHGVSLFGPGGWWVVADPATYSPSAGAWEGGSWMGASGTPANTYPGGPVTSFGCARVDCCPSGTVSAYWNNANTSSSGNVQSTAFPALASNTYGVSAWVKSSGVGNACSQYLALEEYTGAGGFIQEDVIQTVTGTQASWTQLAGTVTLQNTCVYVVLALRVQDTNAGASANGVVWWDNAQLWNQTKTGQTSMPYCEMRFPQAPAQIMVSGIQGDTPAQCAFAFGSLVPGAAGNFNVVIGRKSTASSAMQLVGAAADLSFFAVTDNLTAVLDSTSYGGFYLASPAGSATGSFQPLLVNGTPQALAGTYHLWMRAYTAQSTGNYAKVFLSPLVYTESLAWEQSAFTYLDQYQGATQTPFTVMASSPAWAAADIGSVALPAFARPIYADLTQNNQQVGIVMQDTNGSTQSMRLNWGALVPVDGGLLTGQVSPTSTNTWYWFYADGVGAALGRLSGFVMSSESGALPNEAHAFAGTNGSIAAILSAADPYLVLDPTVSVVGAPTPTVGVNQFVGIIADSTPTGLGFALHTEITYVPQYLYPR